MQPVNPYGDAGVSELANGIKALKTLRILWINSTYTPVLHIVHSRQRWVVGSSEEMCDSDVGAHVHFDERLYLQVLLVWAYISLLAFFFSY